MNKLIIYSTCQGGPMSALLGRSTTLRQEMEIVYHTNFSRPGEAKCDITDEDLRDCRLLLYHPVRDKGTGFSTDRLLERLPDGADAYVVPYVTFSAYWPDFGRVPARPLGVTPDRPYGTLPYRADALDRLLEEMDPDLAVEKFLHPDPVVIEELAQAAIAADLAYLERIDSQSPMKIRQYILDNFRKRQLFFIFNHPKPEIYVHMANQLLAHLGHPPLQERSLDNFSSHAEQNMPVRPALAGVFGVEFAAPETEYSYLGETFTYETFIRHYAKCALADLKGRK